MPYFEPNIKHIRNGQHQDIIQHWCPRSETFASASHLISAINNGWQVNTHIIRKTVTYGTRKARRTNLYYTELRRDDQYMTMPIVESPALVRLFAMGPFEIIDYQPQLKRIPTPLISIA